jgi:hypothetical protein
MESAKISSDDLMRKLVNAKKVMNAVDGGEYKTGNIDESMLTQSTDNVVSQPQSNVSKRNVATNTVNEEKIRNSKLPDSIKNAMIKNPIPTVDQISLSDNLDMSFLDGAKKLMEQEGLSKKTTQSTKPTPQNTNFAGDDIKSIIRETIKDTLEEIVERKLNLLLTAQQTMSINENLVLKVGDSIFKGKVTGVNKSK